MFWILVITIKFPKNKPRAQWKSIVIWANIQEIEWQRFIVVFERVVRYIWWRHTLHLVTAYDQTYQVSRAVCWIFGRYEMFVDKLCNETYSVVDTYWHLDSSNMQPDSNKREQSTKESFLCVWFYCQWQYFKTYCDREQNHIHILLFRLEHHKQYSLWYLALLFLVLLEHNVVYFCHNVRKRLSTTALTTSYLNAKWFFKKNLGHVPVVSNDNMTYWTLLHVLLLSAIFSRQYQPTWVYSVYCKCTLFLNSTTRHVDLLTVHTVHAVVVDLLVPIHHQHPHSPTPTRKCKCKMLMEKTKKNHTLIYIHPTNKHYLLLHHISTTKNNFTPPKC
jgi:hypothetical protein